jgi:hypothetical protein
MRSPADTGNNSAVTGRPSSWRVAHRAISRWPASFIRAPVGPLHASRRHASTLERTCPCRPGPHEPTARPSRSLTAARGLTRPRDPPRRARSPAAGPPREPSCSPHNEDTASRRRRTRAASALPKPSSETSARSARAEQASSRPIVASASAGGVGHSSARHGAREGRGTAPWPARDLRGGRAGRPELRPQLSRVRVDGWAPQAARSQFLRGREWNRTARPGV